MTKKTLFAVTILILLFFGSGILLGVKLKSENNGIASNVQAPSNQDNSYQAGYDAAKKQLLEKNPAIAPLIEMQTKIRYGTIEKISENSIILDNVRTAALPADSKPETFTVDITKDSNFFQLSRKDCAQFQAEMTDFQNKLQKQTPTDQQKISSPQIQEKKAISLADLKEGQLVSITSNEDISDQKDFTAKEVTIMDVQ